MIKSAKLEMSKKKNGTLQGFKISPLKVAGKMLFLFHRWDMLVPRGVDLS